MEMAQVAFRSIVLALLAGALLALPAPRPAHAAGIVVNTFLDANPPVTDGGCSLREAIANANANAAAFPDCAAGSGNDTSTFSVDVVITLVAPLPDITDAAGLIVDGTGRTVVVRGGGSYSLPSWKVTSGAALLLLKVVLDDSATIPSGPGVENDGGNVAVNNSIFVGMRVPLFNKPNGTLVVINSTFLRNKGSAIVNLGTAIVGRSLFFKNEDPCFGCNGGGAVHNAAGATLTLSNSTLSANSALGSGGGLYNAGTASVLNVTIAGNIAFSQGGGIHAAAGTVTLANAISSDNPTVSGGSPPNDCSGTLTATGPNLISTLTGCTITGAAPTVAPAALGPLALNGGPTGTHALLNGSPAINAGDPAVCAAFPVEGKDQRGVARPQGPGCDLGAYESDLAGTTGGRNLTIGSGPINLTWDGGTVQTGYVLLRVNTSTSAVETTPLPGEATSYADTSAVNGVTYCYVLVPTGPAGMLGLSDLVCGVTGSAVGPPLPLGFTLSLKQSATATMTLTSGGPEGTYLLMVPLNGSAPSTTAVTPGTFTKPVPPEGACFVVFADGFGGALGYSNQLCGVPGIGTLRLSGSTDDLETVAERLVLAGSALAEALATVGAGTH